MPEWDNFAQYYDLFFQERTVDVPFWEMCARSFGSPILEFACGTGRLTLPMAREGVNIIGIDISVPMLRIAKGKLKKEPKDIQRRVTFLRVDANAFDLPEKQFSAIFSPWGFSAVTNEEIELSFHSVKNHLGPRGYFVVDTYNFMEPTDDWAHFGIQDHKYFPGKKLTIIRQVQSQGNAETKIIHHLFLWDIIRPNGLMKRIVTERTERLYTKKDMEQLMRQNGFAIVKEYGNYDRTPWSEESPRTIIIARKR